MPNFGDLQVRHEYTFEDENVVFRKLKIKTIVEKTNSKNACCFCNAPYDGKDEKFGAFECLRHDVEFNPKKSPRALFLFCIGCYGSGYVSLIRDEQLYHVMLRYHDCKTWYEPIAHFNLSFHDEPDPAGFAACLA
jgi:hypothetical protein